MPQRGFVLPRLVFNGGRASITRNGDRDDTSYEWQALDSVRRYEYQWRSCSKSWGGSSHPQRCAGSTGEIREDAWSRGVVLTAAQVGLISRLVSGLYQCADCWCWFCREGDKPLVCPACGASYEEADDEAQTP
jgi:hypothetical protein